MHTLHFSILINARREAVWETMLGDEGYPKWTEAFMPGSYFTGDWSKGSKMLFLGPGEKGEMGMVSRIKENRLHEFISIEHLGVVQDGKEVGSSEAEKDWSGALENYTFRDKDGATEVLVDVDTIEEYREYMETAWPKALQSLKELAEKKGRLSEREKMRARILVSAGKKRTKK